MELRPALLHSVSRPRCCKRSFFTLIYIECSTMSFAFAASRGLLRFVHATYARILHVSISVVSEAGTLCHGTVLPCGFSIAAASKSFSYQQEGSLGQVRSHVPCFDNFQPQMLTYRAHVQSSGIIRRSMLQSAEYTPLHYRAIPCLHSQPCPRIRHRQ